MATETLHYETARFAQQLFNNDTGNLRLLEEELEVKATSREGWIKLEGQPRTRASEAGFPIPGRYVEVGDAGEEPGV